MSVVPDAIEPVVAWRCWRTRIGFLESLNGTRWYYQVPMEAICNSRKPHTHRHTGWELVFPDGDVQWYRDDDVEELNAQTGVPGTRYVGRPVVTEEVVEGRHVTNFDFYPPQPRKDIPLGIELPPGWSLRKGTREIVYPPHHWICPAEESVCGIYAAKTLKDLERDQRLGGRVHGEVYLWGKIIEGDYGYRAQFAYPKSLYIEERDDDLEKYEVPIHRKRWWQ